MVHILTENNRIHPWTTYSQEKTKGYVDEQEIENGKVRTLED